MALYIATMVGGFENPVMIDGVPISYPYYKQYYRALDADLSKIPTRSTFHGFVFQMLGFIKIYFSILEYSPLGGHNFHDLYH